MSVQQAGTDVRVLRELEEFPGTVPSVFIMNYVQAHHLDPGFTTGSSNPAHTCARTPSTCKAGHAGPEGV
jgi:hypothetical protein